MEGKNSYSFIIPARRTRKPRLTIRYRTAGERPASAGAPEAEATSAPPPGHGCRLKIEQALAFPGRWGRLTVDGEGPEGERCPKEHLIYLVELPG
jgi:hypothetical protein